MRDSLSRCVTLSLLTGLLSMTTAQASERDHERARQAVQAGRVLPLSTVLGKLATTHPGQVLEVELEHEGDEGRDAWRYEIQLLQRDGQLLKLELDARTGEVLRSKNTAMKILLVEDEPTLRRQLRQALEAAGYVVDEADNGRDAQFLGETETLDAVVLDLGLPVLDGLTVLQRWRAAGRTMPVLILTARDKWSEKVAGIDAGADDYLTKPFHLEELLARLRALIRRASGLASPVLRCGPVALDTRSARVSVAGQPVALTSHEHKLLAYLMHRPDAVVSRTELTEHIYAQDFDRDSNTIEVFVGRLRKKLPTGLIETVRGQGYRLVSAPVEDGP